MEARFITGDGCAIAYRLDGPAGRPVLLLSNSLGMSMDMWAPQMPGLTQRFQVLRYDPRGHGASDAPAGGYSIDRLGRDVIELLDALEIDQVDVCGLSLGGLIGQWLGIREPRRVHRLILANSSSYIGPADAWEARIRLVLKSGMTPLAQPSVMRWFTSTFLERAPDVVATINQMQLAMHPQGYAGTCAAIRDMDMRRTSPLITAPTLIIGGTQDPATPPSHSELLADIIGGARLLMLEAAHLSNVEQPEQFLDAILSHLK